MARIKLKLSVRLSLLWIAIVMAFMVLLSVVIIAFGFKLLYDGDNMNSLMVFICGPMVIMIAFACFLAALEWYVNYKEHHERKASNCDQARLENPEG